MIQDRETGIGFKLETLAWLSNAAWRQSTVGTRRDFVQRRLGTDARIGNAY